VRSKQTGRELKLPNYEKLQQGPRLDQAMMDQIALGLSTRNYEHSIEALCDGYGIKKSSVSRHFIAASRRELDQLLNRKLTDLDIGAVFLDGIHRGGPLRDRRSGRGARRRQSGRYRTGNSVFGVGCL
jgi:transposase-like protein